jgi:hypothetical protein
MSDPARFYDILSVDERFRLFVAAAARRDEQELDRLNATCPQKTYRMPDYEYIRRKSMFWLLAVTHCNEVHRLDLAVTALLLLLIATEDGEDEARCDQVVEQITTLPRRRQVKRAAWQRFCERVGIPEEQPAAALGSATESADDPILGSLAELMGEIELDEQAVARETEFLSGLLGN